jgi:nicotinate-nucleotide--dimethylbenzimidazole phosphoribosyltransferase
VGPGTGLTCVDVSEDNSPLAGVKVPFPDAAYATRTSTRLAEALVPGTGLGKLGAAIAWAGRVQGTDRPVPFRNVTGLVVTGAHHGGFAAGDDDPGKPLGDASALFERLAERAGVPLRYLETVPGAPAEDGPVLSDDDYIEALAQGQQAADGCIDAGADLIVLSATGPGTTAAAIAVAAHLTRTPPVELSPRMLLPGAVIDDNIWMRRTAAIRDTFARLNGPARDARTTLTEFGGPVIATATAIIVAAAVRRTPLLIDGPVGAAAALVARDFSLGAPKWCYAPDRMPHPVVDKAAKQVGMAEPLGFGVDVGEGCAMLAALPVLQDALRLANDLPFPAEPEPEPSAPGISGLDSDADPEKPANGT